MSWLWLWSFVLIECITFVPQWTEVEASEVWDGSQGRILMSGPIRSTSHADCQVTEECHVPADAELMELGPLLEENGPIGAKGVQSEASHVINYQNALQGLSYSVPTVLHPFFELWLCPQEANCLADDEEEDEDVGDVLTLPLQAHHAMEKMEEFVHKVWSSCINVLNLKQKWN